MFTEEDLGQIPNFRKIIPKYPIGKHQHNCRNGLKKLKKFKNKRKKRKESMSAGPDGIHSQILKETAKAICSTLAIIFNKSMQEGQVPQGGKEAHVTALHKKGSKSNPENYTSISLTSVSGKVMESLI